MVSMTKEEKSKIEKMIEKNMKVLHNCSGGPMAISENKKGNNSLNLSNFAFNTIKEKDLLIHIKYFPKENRYKFTIYEDKKGWTGIGESEPSERYDGKFRIINKSYKSHNDSGGTGTGY